MPVNSVATRGGSVPDRLIETGEHLFGTYGIQGTSLRQISAAAGTRNNYAVQYHFGDLDGLLAAIIKKRMLEFEHRLAVLLVREDGEAGPRRLLEILYEPFFDKHSGGPVTARFMLALLTAPEGWKPLDDMFVAMSTTQQIFQSIANETQLPLRLIWQRMRRVSLMILAFSSDAPVAGDIAEVHLAMRRDTFDMAAAALTAPVREPLTLLVEGAKTYFMR